MRISDWSSDVCSSDLRVQRRPAALAAVRSLQRRIQVGPEQFEVDQCAQLLQRIARRRQCRIPLIKIEKPTLYRHPSLHRRAPRWTQTMPQNSSSKSGAPTDLRCLNVMTKRSDTRRDGKECDSKIK